jgi:ParB family chromosome partitioning protein
MVDTQNSASVTAPQNACDVQLIALERIKVGKQPRCYFSETSIALLAQSFCKHGFQGVINVRPLGQEQYLLVAGERRYRAALLAGLSAVHCVVNDFTDGEALEFALRENLQREDLSKLEETQGLLDLISFKLGLDEAHLIDIINREGRLVGKNNDVLTSTTFSSDFQQIAAILQSFGVGVQTFRTKHLKTLSLPEDVKQAHLEKGLPYSSAIALARVKDESFREALLNQVLSKEFSYSDLQSILGQVLPTREISSEVPKPSDRLRAIAKRLRVVETSVSNQAELDAVIDRFIDALELLCQS